jgi:RimJ/RimL family protein N-acetyltransferase
MTLIARLLGPAEYATYMSWRADAELAARLSIGSSWFAYVSETPGVYAWMIFDDELPVAVVQFGADPFPSLSVAINPVLRGRGLCRPVLRFVLDLPELEPFEMVYGFVEPDNSASLRCAAALGEIDETPDDDGLLRVTFSRSAVASQAPI